MALAGEVLLLVVIAGALSFYCRRTRGSLLIGVATLGAVPAVMAMARVSTIARGSKTDHLAVVDAFVSFRRVLGRQLRSLGSLVALATLALEVSPFTSLSSAEGSLRRGTVLVLGGVGSVIVAVAYVPVALTLRNPVHALAKHLLPMPVADGKSASGELVLECLDRRQTLTKLLSVSEASMGSWWKAW